MLIIEQAALSNGAHRSQQGDSLPLPDGYLTVPPELEEEAWGYLPFLLLTVENGAITAVAQGEIPEPEEKPEGEATVEEIVNILLGVAEDE